MFIVSTATFYSKIIVISHGHPAVCNVQYPAPVHYSFNFPHPVCTNQVEEIFNHRFIIVVRFFLSFFLFFRIKNNGRMTTARVMIYLCDGKPFHHRRRQRQQQRLWQWQWQ